MAKATRESFGEALAELGDGDERIWALDGDLMKSTYTHLFREKHPDRFVECGIAEKNMIGVAAGLALAGKVPFAASFACFIANRVEVIRMSVGYTDVNVRLCGTHAGIGIGDDGASQMGLEDVASMRALPNMAVIQPADDRETRQAVEYLVGHDGPAYLRLTRQKLEDVNDDSYRFEFGKAVQLRDGSDVCLIGTEATVQEALKAADELARDGIESRVLNVHTIKPLDADAIRAAAAACGRIVTVEDHNVAGGLGSAVAEVLAMSDGARLSIVGVHDYGQSGSQEELYDAYGIDAAHVANVARKAVA
jgi:transketolase